MYILNPAGAQYAVTGVASAQVATGLVSGQRYEVTVDVNHVIAQGATPTAALSAGSVLVVPGRPAYIDGIHGAVLAARTLTGAGDISITPVLELG